MEVQHNLIDDSPQEFNNINEKIEIKSEDKKAREIFKACELPELSRTISERMGFVGRFIVVGALSGGLTYLSLKVAIAVFVVFVVKEFASYMLRENIILPAIKFHKNYMDDKEFNDKVKKSETNSLVQATTPDGCQLRGVIKFRKSEDKNTFESYNNDKTIESLKLTNDKFVLYLSGNAECYQGNYNNGFLNHMSEVVGANVLAINYRQVADSKDTFTGTKDLITDAHTWYCYLRDYLKIPEDKIVVYARSIGGGIGGEMGVLDKIKHIVFERTYSDLSAVATGISEGWSTQEIENIFHKKVENVSLEQKIESANEIFPNERSVVRGVTSLIQFFISKVLYLLGLELGTVAAIRKLLEQGTNIMVATGGKDFLMQNGGALYKG